MFGSRLDLASKSLAIRIRDEIRTPISCCHATFERSSIEVRIFVDKSSYNFAVFGDIVNILMIFIGLEI